MKVGPINTLNGFPLWYEDQNGLRLMLNTDPFDPFNIVSPADIPNPGLPVSFPDNFPSEAFYFTAEAEMETGTGERARLVLALEAAFVNEVPRDGEQIVFGRVRIRIDGLEPNAEYVVTHPYGVDTFIAVPDGAGAGEIDFTEDIGGLNGGNFELALNSRVFPFLQWDPSVAPQAPDGYIGDPNLLHPVSGSPFGNQRNVFRIEGPGIGVGSPDRVTDNRIETRLFSVSGKLSTLSGVDVSRVTYTQSDFAGGFIDIFATSDVLPQTIEVTGSEFNPTILQGENGFYFARVEFTSENPPSTVTVRNLDDNDPASIKEVVPVDFITATADYNNDEKTLAITAFSSDEVHLVELRLADFGEGDLPIPASGLTIAALGVPANITILSTAGGSRSIPVTVNGLDNPPIGVIANAGSGQTVIINSEVTLDGTGSTGPISGYQWSQVSGTAVTLLDANTETTSFTSPNEIAALVFELTVEGEGGPSSDSVTIEVIESAAAPVANAGPNQTVQQGSVVTLIGSATGIVSSYQWVQISGPVVQLSGANSPIATFTFPNQSTTLTFRLMVTGPGGSSTDEIQLSTVADVLTVTRAEFRTDDSEWRISGTSSVFGSIITIFISNTLIGQVLTQVSADALGQWEYRIEPSNLVPNATRAISIQSSSGGTLINVPLNVRN